jgi:hypothetical protein
MPSRSLPLAADLTARLREIVRDGPETESELRQVSEQAEALVRLLEAQAEASERRLRELTRDSASSLAEITVELRRVDAIRPELNEARALVGDLADRGRELRTQWLLHQAESASPARRSSS